ncbi:Pfam:CXC [Phytophthora pseudosyringae]|uniref:Pfam:CXC n=1 Tax=Phytophthora pseudosyringae TaxID=221518 RepID=A0A8T1W3Q3_9STRA|nr:Pfam:CXC [Phytophthora pseudosyringae]
MNPDHADLGGRRRGCNCKKSGCLKLYCECFAASGRCSERCQCAGCKNREHNQGEIAQAVQAIQKRTQKSSRPSLLPARASEPESAASRPRPTSSDAPATFPTERKAAMAMAGTSPRPVCACADGNCANDCPCLSLFGACSPRCLCRGCQVQAQPERTKGCSCKKSNCLKLYCECLAAQRMCDHRCNCEGCKNRPETLAERERAVAAILERNPLAFQPKVASGSSQHLRGCNCRKSGCMKNYCECHQAGVACTSRCACHQCRNTETFISAKKMLVFAGVSADDSNLRVTIPSQRKLAKRPSRGSAKKADPQNGMHTPTNQSTQGPSALELLSRSAPVAPSTMGQRDDSAMDGIPPTTPTKRPSSHVEHFHTAGGGEVTPTFAKRKYTRRSSSKLPFMERIQEASAPAVDLPSVEDTVTNAYDARNTEGVGDPELTILSRSLLHTAMAVELADEEKEDTTTASASQPLIEQQSGAIKPQRVPDHSDGREALSPTAAGLFCEEEYSEAAADDESHLTSNGNGAAENSTTVDNESNPSSRRGEKPSLSVMQERAVLQEFSVWLRNLAAGVPSY